MQPLKLRELPHTEQPIGRLHDAGAGSLSTAELLEVIVGLARGRELLVHLGGLEGLLTASPEQISKIPGIGPAKAARLLAAVELGRRTMALPGEQRRRITSPAGAAEIFLARLAGELQEQFVEMLLDTRLGVMGLVTVFIGTCNTTHVRVAEVMRPAVIQGAASIILCHNHPSGDISPSPEDAHITEVIVQAGEIFGIDIVDHIIVSSSGSWRWMSMKERGLGGL